MIYAVERFGCDSMSEIEGFTDLVFCEDCLENNLIENLIAENCDWVFDSIKSNLC